MAKIVRKSQKIFGSSAGTDQIAEFGSLFAGTPVFTTDPAVIQSLSNYLTGWYAAAIGTPQGNSPAIEDMNAICYLFAYQIAYLMQAGVAEWDSGTTYYTGSLVNDGIGNMYVSILDNNLNNAVTNTTYWRVALRNTLSQYCYNIGDSTGTPQQFNTNLLAENPEVVNASTVTISIASPGVVTQSSHGLVTGNKVYFQTTGALPTGLAVNTTYYVIFVSSSTYQLATSLSNAVAGTAINTSGSQSGTHTAFSGSISQVGRVFTVSTATASIPPTHTIDTILVDTSGQPGGINITLPNPALSVGRVLTFTQSAGTAGFNINRFASETINGLSSFNVLGTNGFASVATNGTNWYVTSQGDYGSYSPISTSNNSAVVTSGNITLLGGANIKFSKMGTMVTLWGAFNLNAAGAGVADFRISLPFPSTFTLSAEASGVIVAENADGTTVRSPAGYVMADTTNHQIRFVTTIGNTGAEIVRFNIGYIIK